MQWIVKNALSRDVEREHLNKILAEIRGEVDKLSEQTGQATSAPPVTYITQNNITQGLASVTAVLEGAVTGTGTTDDDGRLVITTLLSEEQMTPPPDDGEAYWWQDGQWTLVPLAAISLEFLEPAGFTVIDNDFNWVARTIEGTAGQIVVTDGDGLLANPVISLDDVPDLGGGQLLRIVRDSKGRVTGTSAAKVEDLSDVDITDREDQSILVYDAGLSTYKHQLQVGSLKLDSGAVIHARRAVRAENGQILHPDTSDNTHAYQVVGVATTAAAVSGQDVIVRTHGTIEEATWTWTPGYIYCDDDGVLTQTIPATGWLLRVARAISPTVIDVDIDTPYIRS